MFDPLSQMYIWNENQKTAYLLAEKVEGADAVELQADHYVVSKQNWFSFLMDFSYYANIGLLTDEMLQQAALYQRTAPEMYEDLYSAADNLGNN